MSTDTANKVVACKLTNAELQKRKAEVIAKLKSKVITREELPNGFKYTFQGVDNILDDIVGFIKTERLCCNFFTFNLFIQDTESPLTLSITGPNGTKDFINSEMDL
jgi:hypothetical protein